MISLDLSLLDSFVCDDDDNNNNYDVYSNRAQRCMNFQQEIEIEGEPVKVDIPMTVGFFWPDSEG